uniref:UPF0481 protein n=1 Tax=Noccaea caerulescens TaxID=107243 RepID=A0A1J3J3K3_NOCCA
MPLSSRMYKGMDLEQGIKLTSLTDNEPPELVVDRTMENETGSGNVARWREGVRGPWDPNHGTSQKAKVWSTTKPGSFSETAIPGLWPSSFSKEYCCIYRVPNRLRRVNPEAYTPQMLLIGALQHSKKAEALELSKTDSRYLDYMNMERHKKKYLNGIANIFGKTVEEFREIIERDEKFIRESYSESTDWIKSQEFVEMILQDSVFILGFFIQMGTQKFNRNEDILFEEPCLITTIFEDLILLENQLPYALLEELFEPFLFSLKTEETFRDLTLRVFGFENKIERDVKFQHFTDLLRRVRVATLGLTEEQASNAKSEPPKSIKSLHNADKLDSAGVDFENVDKENDLTLVIDFKDGVLKMPCFTAEDNTERVMRNLMALEQCHYPFSAYVCNYIAFLDFLIDTEQDVNLLFKKGVLKNWMGHQGSVAEMVNRLCLGLVDFGSHYQPIAETLNNHYESPLNRSVATLRRVYFKDLWTGTATVAAVVLLVLTLIQTVASVLQVTQNNDKSSPPPAPGRGP